MSKEKHQQYLLRSAQSTLAKLSERQRKTDWTKEELKKVRIQTLEPYKRLILGVVGTGFLLWAVFGSPTGWVALLLGLLGVIVIAMGIFGIRRTLGAVLEGGLEGAFDLLCALVD